VAAGTRRVASESARGGRSDQDREPAQDRQSAQGGQSAQDQAGDRAQGPGADGGDGTAGSRRAMRAHARRNRASVLAAAEEAFAEAGSTVSLDEIARRAGVGAGTVYRHFPSKEALFEAIIEDRLQHLTEQARELTAAQDPGTAFFGFLAQMVRDHGLKRDLAQALADAGYTPKARAGESFHVLLAGLLRRAQEAGAVRTDVDAEDVRAVIVGCLAMERARGDTEPGRITAVVWDGLRPRTR